MPDKPPALPPIPSVSKITEVVEAIESIIDWSIGASSRLGYFAALYKRITIAVRTALAQGVFQDAPRMERLDVTFASRYFEALNGYFHPGKFPKPTRSWQVTFNAASRAEPIILQHMLAGVNVHIGLDLGIAAQSIGAGGQLPALQEDFNRINAVLASQVGGVVADIDQLSPALADLYAVLTSNEIFLIDEAVKTLRDSAWRFATILSLEPWFLRPMTIWARDWEVAAQVQAIYDPPNVTGLIDLILRSIAAQESRDIVKNISVLDTIASKPAPIRLDHVTATNIQTNEDWTALSTICETLRIGPTTLYRYLAEQRRGLTDFLWVYALAPTARRLPTHLPLG